MASKSAFDRLRPLCVALTKCPSRKGLEELREKLKSEERSELQELQEYVLFPLRIIVKQGVKFSEELCTDAISCMCLVLERTEVRKWDMFHDIFNSLCLLISSPTEPGKLSHHSEELKLATVQCLQALLSHSVVNVLQAAYSASFIPALGHSVSLLLHMVDTESARHLKKAAMQCLMALGQCDGKVPCSLSVQIGDTFASFLPGIAMGLCKIISGDTKQGTSVIVCAVEAWTKLVTLVMGDVNLEKSRELRNKSQPANSNTPHRQLQVQRTEEWAKSTSEKLILLIKRIGSVVTHSNWKVRLSLVEWAESFLTVCSKSLSNCVPQFLETLVSLLGDDYPNVATRSKQALTTFQQNCEATEQIKPLVELLEENLLHLATSLPRVMRVADDRDKLMTLKLFTGYLQLLGSKVNTMFYSHHHLRRLAQALVQVLEMDCTDMKIIEERTQSPGGLHQLDIHHSSLRKYFQHFHDDKIYQEVTVICRTLAHFGDIQLLMDHFLDVYHESSAHRKEAAMILNELALGVVGDSVESDLKTVAKTRPEVEDLIRSLCEDYLSPANFDLPTAVQSEATNYSNTCSNWLLQTDPKRGGLSLAALNSNIMQICIELEGIGNFSKVLQSEFNKLLISILYPLLEKLGSHVAIISHTAYQTLCTVSSSCGYSGISELLCCNSDYLVNSISLRLRHLGRNPQAPLVLQVILQYSDEEIMNYIEDTIKEILDVLDQHHDEEAAIFLRVLHTLSVSILRWYPPDQKLKTDWTETDSKNKDVKREKLTSDQLLNFFLDYQKHKQIAEDLDNSDFDDEKEDQSQLSADEKQSKIDEDSQFETDHSEEKKKETPRHIKLIMEVLERCKHLMSSADPRLRLLVLDIIVSGCHVLAGYQDDLLPLVHKLWSPFVNRLNDEEQVVIRKAFQVLCVMAEVSKDFIRSRVSKEVLPKIAAVLKKQAQVSFRVGASYKFTMAFKMQAALLHGIGHICEQLSVSENDLDLVTSSCLPYLSSRQPRPLQEAAIGALESLTRVDGDIVWLKLVDIYHKDPLVPPDSYFPVVKLCSHPGMKDEFSNNIERLLMLL
ncbi:TELO2-interacting protein 1 homolog [Lingula anatina]|uniref:TELO2-interacting protein 1 homolog n=1 Tax=Lingula anatina TaxID=7574 RepID=A0A1S3H4E5_LINAN|nr:TELO2-interacting protein 1 homolog [Lingula anatina]|eukprot:XP_013380878.1 TELO2-interacting protein 1 homolog [Lingula anatina]